MLEQLTDRIRTIVEGREAVGFDVKFDLGDTGHIFVAGSDAPMQVNNDDKQAETTFHMTAQDFAEMLDGTLAPTMAYMQGKLKIDGDLSQAMKLASLFG
jgi:putative sterol carrier protein